eukprot:6456590-Amphidinium_carterae.1
MFQTHVAQPYPPSMAIMYGKLLSDALRMRKSALDVGQSTPLADSSNASQFPAQLALWQKVVRSQMSMVSVVPEGLGAHVGLSVLQQVEHAISQEHPLLHKFNALRPELVDAIQYELCTEAEDVDRFRSEVLRYWLHQAVALQDERVRWASAAPLQIRSLVGKLHGPLIAVMLNAVKLDDPSFLHDLLYGFPLV